MIQTYVLYCARGSSLKIVILKYCVPEFGWTRGKSAHSIILFDISRAETINLALTDLHQRTKKYREGLYDIMWVLS